MKRYKFLAVMLIIMSFLTILGLHSYYNFVEIIDPPSEIWGRDINTNKITPYKKQVSINTLEGKTGVLVADQNSFENIIIDKENKSISKVVYGIKDASLNKLVKYQISGKSIFWTENFTLYYAAAVNGSNKTMIAESVNDFQTLESSDGSYIVAATKEGIKLYKYDNTNLVQLGETFRFNNSQGVSFVKDNGGILHLAAFSSINDIEYPIKYLNFADGKWIVKGEKSEKILFRSWKIDNIDIGLDNNNAYIFYGLSKWDAFGVSGRTYYAAVPFSYNESTMIFTTLLLDPEDDPNTAFVNSARCSKVQGENLKIALINDDEGIRSMNGFVVYFGTMEAGKLKEKVKASTLRDYMTGLDFKDIGNEFAIAYINTAENHNYQALYSETSDEFKAFANKGTTTDYTYALINTIPGYVNSLLAILIKMCIFFPALVWLIIIEVFEMRRFKDSKLLTLGIAYTIYMVIKLLVSGSNYTEATIPLMPPILSFSGAQYFYTLVVALLSYAIVRLFKKSNKDMGNIAEFLIFTALDVTFMSLLYMTYLL